MEFIKWNLLNGTYKMQQAMPKNFKRSIMLIIHKNKKSYDKKKEKGRPKGSKNGQGQR